MDVSKKTGNYSIPFEKDGNHLHWAGDDEDVEWRENFEFDASLRVVGMRTGRSAKHIMLEDCDTGLRYVLFVADLVDAVTQFTVSAAFFKGDLHSPSVAKTSVSA